MRLPRRQVLSLMICGSVLLAGPDSAYPQTYPSRPITIVAPFPAGGAVDTIGRLLAERMQESLGQAGHCRKCDWSWGQRRPRPCRPCGKRWIYAQPGHFQHTRLERRDDGVAIRRSERFRADRSPLKPAIDDRRQEGHAGEQSQGIDRRGCNRTRTRPPKLRPGKAIFSISVGVLFQRTTNTRYAFVPYRGTNLAMQDLVAGSHRHDFRSSVALHSARAGWHDQGLCSHGEELDWQQHPMCRRRTRQAYRDFTTPSGWVFGRPKAHPKPPCPRSMRLSTGALANPTVRSRLQDLGHELYPREQQTPKALAELQKSEVAKWWPIVKAAGIK